MYHVHLQVGDADFGTCKELYFHDPVTNLDKKFVGQPSATEVGMAFICFCVGVGVVYYID